MSRRGQRLPDQPTHLQRLTRLNDRIVRKTVGALACRLQHQGLGIPFGDHALDAGGDVDRTAGGVL